MIFDEPYFAFSDIKETPTFNTSFLTYDEATALNEKKYAICIIPNIVVGGRNNSNVTKIRAWFCDIDYVGPKPDIDDILQISPLIPTYVVESKNGYHLYFLSKYQFNFSANYTAQQVSVIDFFGGDGKCKNVARLMRCPGFVHNKTDPFNVEIIFETIARYSEGQMAQAFPIPDESADEEPPVVEYSANNDSSINIFDKIRHYSSRIILQALSGTSAVAGKKYKFVSKGKGHYNIWVDGKDSGCFINEAGNVIGASEYSGGAVEWLTFYGHSRAAAAKEICEVMGWEFKR